LTDPTVRLLTPEDWQTYREIRLAMLWESPGAFGSRYADAVRFDEDTWRGRLTSCDHHLAEVDGRAVGAAGLYVEDGVADLIGMWVRPQARGRSVGALLVQAVLDRAAVLGCDRVRLEVVDGNVPARRLYERMGFISTGVITTYENAPGGTESEMVRLL
jgi:ribosomal protein S18 acetylase RimI-like enzyme